MPLKHLFRASKTLSKNNLALPSSAAEKPIAFANKLWHGDRASAVRGLVAAAALHAGLVVLMVLVGRIALFPNLIDGYGILGPFRSDSHGYRLEAMSLATILTDGGVSAWAWAPAQIHIKLISLLFVLLGPAFGPNILSVEPLNLAVYLLILFFVFKLAEEVGNRRVGIIAACAVAIWPSFLLHTTQLLRDPLYIAAVLAIIFVASTWLTRTYRWHSALVSGVMGGAIIGTLTLIREGSGMVVLTVVTLGVVLLALRQLRTRRLLGWNSFSAILVFLFMVTFLAQGVVRFQSLRPASQEPELSNSYPNNQGLNNQQATTFLSALKARADLDAARVGRLRRGFTHGYSDAGSIIDAEVQFNSTFDLIRYLPRAMAVGFVSPFPGTWFVKGRNVGLAGKLISAGETLVMYVIEILALIGFWRSRRSFAAWLLLLITTFGLTMLGFVVANIGTLYRMRYVFWILLIILGAKGLDSLITERRRPATHDQYAIPDVQR